MKDPTFPFQILVICLFILLRRQIAEKLFVQNSVNKICNLGIVKGKLISDIFGLIFFYIVSQISSSLFFLNTVLWSYFCGVWGVFLLCFFFFLFVFFILIRGWKTISIQLISHMRNLHLFPVSKYGFSTYIYSDPDHNGTVSGALQEFTCFFQDLVMENLESNISCLSEGCLFSKILSYLAF